MDAVTLRFDPRPIRVFETGDEWIVDFADHSAQGPWGGGASDLIRDVCDRVHPAICAVLPAQCDRGSAWTRLNAQGQLHDVLLNQVLFGVLGDAIRCDDCAGSGKLPLFTSVEPCARCSGHGSLFRTPLDLPSEAFLLR
jgi:hypothetical protein